MRKILRRVPQFARHRPSAARQKRQTTPLCIVLKHYSILIWELQRFSCAFLLQNLRFYPLLTKCVDSCPFHVSGAPYHPNRPQKKAPISPREDRCLYNFYSGVLVPVVDSVGSDPKEGTVVIALVVVLAADVAGALVVVIAPAAVCVLQGSGIKLDLYTPT